MGRGVQRISSNSVVKVHAKHVSNDSNFFLSYVARMVQWLSFVLGR